MKTGSFAYEVKVEVEITGLELLALFNGASGHYDSRCRMAAEPARTAGGYVLPVGGEIWGLLNQFVSANEYREGEKSVDMFRRVLAENPERTITHELSARTMDLFAKCVEMPFGVPDEEVRASQSVYFGLRKARQAILDERARLEGAPA